MPISRRMIAFFVTLAVAWTALWPLVSAARAASLDMVVPLCHQAGTQVPPGEAPDQPGAPAGEAKFHCPLCVMAFYAAFIAPPAPQPPVFACRAAWSGTYCSPHPAGLEVQLPQSRAPPPLS